MLFCKDKNFLPFNKFCDLALTECHCPKIPSNHDADEGKPMVDANAAFPQRVSFTFFQREYSTHEDGDIVYLA